MSEGLYVSAAPVFKVDGQPAGELARDLLRLEVEETTEGLKTLSLRVLAFGRRAGETDETLLYLDGRLLDFGKKIEVSLGPSGNEAKVFDGVISGIEASYQEEREPEVVVLAEDRLMDLRMTRRMRTYEQVTDAQIAERIASDHGLGADVSATGPTYDRVQQWNRSDLAFLRERAELIQAELWVDASTLHFRGRDSRSGPSLTLVQGNELLAVSLRADLAHQRTSVRVTGYDAEARDQIDEESGAQAIQAEATGGQTGAAVLQRAFGDRVMYLDRQVPLTSAEARDWAKGEMLRRGRRFVTVSGTTRGSPTLAVGSRLRLDRVGPPFDGDGYYATRVSHTYDLRDGYRTRFEAERATVNNAGG